MIVPKLELSVMVAQIGGVQAGLIALSGRGGGHSWMVGGLMSAGGDDRLLRSAATGRSCCRDVGDRLKLLAAQCGATSCWW